MQSKFDFNSKIWHGPSYNHPYPMDCMFSDYLFEKLYSDQDRVVQISADDGVKLNVEELKLSSIRVAQNLLRNGLKSDDVVGIITHQSHFATIFLTGCTLIGILPNPLDASLSESDIRIIFFQTKPKIIICDEEAISKVENALEDVDFKFTIFSTSSEHSIYQSASNFLNETKEEDKFIPPKFLKSSEEKILCILCSSGTSGSPKGVSISHANYLSYMQVASSSNQSVSLSFSPLYWGSGFFKNLTAAVSSNDLRIFTEKQFDVKTFIEIVERYKVTSVTMPPSQLAALLNSEEFLTSDTKSLRAFLVVGAIVSKVLREKFETIFSDKIMMVLYGMTEVLVSMTRPFEYKKEFSVGSILFPYIQVKIIDDEGRALDNGQQGEICVKPNLKFLGYYNNPTATESSYDDEQFIKTGDLGYFDDEGILYVVDRKKEIIKCKGYHVNPSEIENLIQSIEGIELVSVVGLPNDFCYNLLTAAVVKKQGFEELNEDRIVKFIASHMPDYKHLHGGVFFFNKLPMTASGKIQKRFVLKEILQITENTLSANKDN